MEQKTIGKFITALRKANGMTQKELAEELCKNNKLLIEKYFHFVLPVNIFHVTLIVTNLTPKYCIAVKDRV